MEGWGGDQVSAHRFAHDDACYVLGALSAAERRAFEEHLAGCVDCARSVGGLAGIPGLLARVDESAFTTTTDPAPPLPDTLLPRLLGEARRWRRRSHLLALIGVAASALLVLVLGAVLLLHGSGPSPEPDVPAHTQAMTQVNQQLLSATVAMEPVAWGTRIHLTWTYDSQGWAGERPPSYALIVRARDGSVEQVATWRFVPGKEMHLEGVTAADPGQIASVDVVVPGTDRRMLSLTTSRS